MGGTIQGEFGWSNAGLINGMAEAQKIAQKGAQGVEAKIASLFKRDPTQRAERAIGTFIQSLASGDVVGGIQNLTGAMSAFGLAAGVAIGAGIALFMKFRDQIVAAREAHQALQEEMIRRPLSLTSRLSTEGMGEALEARRKLAEDARKKTESSSLGRELLEGAKSTLPFFFGGRASEDQERIQTQKDVNMALAEAKQIEMDRARLMLTMSNIETTRVLGFEREANIAKIILDAEQKRAALQASGVSREAFEAGDEAISRNAEAMVKLENQRAEAKERSLKIEERMAELISKGLKPEDQRKVRTGLELKDIETQLKGTGLSDPERRQLQLQRQQKINELAGMGKGPEGENPFQFGTISAREFERQAETQKFNDQFARFGMTQQQLDLKPGKQPNQDVLNETKRVGDLIEKYWGQK